MRSVNGQVSRVGGRFIQRQSRDRKVRKFASVMTSFLSASPPNVTWYVIIIIIFVLYDVVKTQHANDMDRTVKKHEVTEVLDC